MTPWTLPRSAVIGGEQYPIHADFRDILEIIGYLEDVSRPEFLRWQVALALFYDRQPPAREGMEYLCSFLRGGEQESAPGPKLLDWQQDAGVIVSEVNRVAGQEIRALPFVHWWTFLGWFHAIGQGQLSALVGVRDKLRRGQKLEAWEQEFYRENRSRIVLKKRRTPEETEEMARLERLLEVRHPLRRLSAAPGCDC